jgi:predicted transcriptional regulator
MRITLDLDDDVAEIARRLGRERTSTMGKVVSELIRRGLEPRIPAKTRNGVPLFILKPGAREPGVALVNGLRDEA